MTRNKLKIKDKDVKDNSKPKQEAEEQSDFSEQEYEEWDRWYDDSQTYNKKSRLNRTNKRSYKNHNDW